MSTGDLTHQIPAADDGWRERIEKKLDAVVVALLGDLKNPGGAMRRLDRAETRLDALEAARTQATNQALTWKNALGLTLAGGLVAKALDWVQHHLK